MNFFDPLLCELQKTVTVESDNNSNNNFTYKGHRPEPLSRPGSDGALEYHCSVCNSYKSTKDFFNSCIKRRVRYCKQCMKQQHKKRLLRNAHLNHDVLHASRVLRILRRDVKQQEGQRVAFNVQTARKLLKYWSTFSASCEATKVSFVVWRPVDIVRPDDVVVFKHTVARKLRALPVEVRQRLFTSEAIADIENHLEGVNAFLMNCS